MLSFLSLCAALHIPSGHSYRDTFRIPLVGTQSVQMDILNSSHAKITLDGIMCSSGMVEYESGDDGALSFVIQEPLFSLMKRYRCSLTHPVYNTAKNEAHVTLNIHPLFFSKCLHLKLRKEQTDVEPGHAT